MNSKNNIVTGILILIVGVVFIFMQSRQNVLHGIVMILGALFIVAGVVNIVMMMTGKSRGSTAIPGSLAGLAALALGIWMVVSPGAIISVIVYAFAALLIVGGAYHLYMLAYGYRPLTFPGWFYILPSLLVVTGVTMLLIGSARLQNYVVLITGIAMVIFGVNSILEYAGEQSYDRGQRKALPRE